MQNIYKVSEGHGRCSCGHSVVKGRGYFLIDMQTRAYTLCNECGKEQGLDKWWGAREMISPEQMHEHWFNAEPIKEIVCRQLKQYVRERRDSSKKEEMLRVAVEV